MNKKSSQQINNRSILRNLLISMLGFGLLVGLIFPPFAHLVLKTDEAYSLLFISICIIAGLIVGFANYMLFNFVVTKELANIQNGMDHIHENISEIEIMESNCLEECTLHVNSKDIIGDISHSFNNMAFEIFKRLELEGETRHLNSALIDSVELTDVAKTILKKISGVLDAKAGLLYGGSADEMQMYARFGVDENAVKQTLYPGTFGPLEKSLNSGNIEQYAQIKGWEWFGQSTPLGNFRPGSIIVVPLMAKNTSVGLVILACDDTSIDQEQHKTIQALCSFAAPYMDNSILHKRIRDLAAIDELTGILNRRFGMRRLKEEFSRATRHGAPISAVMMDIDHFKNFNDAFGHNAGDVVLKMVAKTIQENIRMEDMACRYGGEEFLVGLSGAGMNDSAIIIERIRRAIETNHINWGGKQLHVTISCGIATYPIVRASVCEELITSADQALYAAKDFGRNQVTINDGSRHLKFSDLEIDQMK